MTITGAVYPAIDLTAGERERGTLEVLMAAPVPRVQLLVAKYVAVLTVALLTAAVNLVAMTATVLLGDLGPILFAKGSLTVGFVVTVLGALALFAAFFSALLLVLASFARSFKEAQAYLIPLMLVAMAPGLLSLLPWLRLNAGLAAVPLLNIVLLTREQMRGEADPMLTVLFCFRPLTRCALAVAAKVFTEDVLYGDSASIPCSGPHRKRAHCFSAGAGAVAVMLPASCCDGLMEN